MHTHIHLYVYRIITALSPYLFACFFPGTCLILGLCSAEQFIVTAVDGTCSAQFPGFSWCLERNMNTDVGMYTQILRMKTRRNCPRFIPSGVALTLLVYQCCTSCFCAMHLVLKEDQNCASLHSGKLICSVIQKCWVYHSLGAVDLHEMFCFSLTPTRQYFNILKFNRFLY